MSQTTRKASVAVAVVAALGLGGAGVAAATGGGSDQRSASRLDDGKDLLTQAKVSEAEATRAAETVASGPLHETDLEHLNGRLVFNVDVGRKDVKVDAATGKVLRVDADD